MTTAATRQWETRFQRWAARSSDTEDDQRIRTERLIREAVRAHPRLASAPIRIFAKGSYKNNTNVRQDSDVDIAVEYYGSFYSDNVPLDSQVREALAFKDYEGPFTPAFLKDCVEEALRARFREAVTRHNKCITVADSAGTLAADVVPCFEYRWYYKPPRPDGYHQGIAIVPDRGAGYIRNYPQQHYDQGVRKNNLTLRRYKRVVRGLKRLENDMVTSGRIAPVPSFLIESLVHNCPDRLFNQGDSYFAIAWSCLDWLAVHTSGVEPSDEDARLLEANRIKFLFHYQQKWTRGDARTFVQAARDRIGTPP